MRGGTPAESGSSGVGGAAGGTLAGEAGWWAAACGLAGEAAVEAVVAPGEAVRVLLGAGAAVAVAVVVADWVARQAGNSGRDGGPAAAVRGGQVVAPDEGVEPAPEKAADCRSQQECTCPTGPGGAPRASGSAQPAEMTGQQRVADEGNRVDECVRQDQRPQPSGALPGIPEN